MRANVAVESAPRWLQQPLRPRLLDGRALHHACRLGSSRPLGLDERLSLARLSYDMPHDSRRVYATQRIRVSRRVRARASYVFAWCTDYRSDDWKVSRAGTHPRFQVVRLSPRRILRIRLTGREGRDPDVAVDLIRLDPPFRWHTDQIDEEELEAVDYRVTALGRDRSRLDVSVTDRWMTPHHLSRAETAERVNGAWDRYIGLIEARYRSGLPARG